MCFNKVLKSVRVISVYIYGAYDFYFFGGKNIMLMKLINVYGLDYIALKEKKKLSYQIMNGENRYEKGDLGSN